MIIEWQKTPYKAINSVQQPKMLNLQINKNQNANLLQNFPNDPYYDITIITRCTSLHLASAHLTCESSFFANLPTSQKEVDLAHLNDKYLTAVLRSLYGGQLNAATVNDLDEIYQIIMALGIEEYKQIVYEQLLLLHDTKKQSIVFASIQILEFCLKNRVLVDQITKFHFQSNLKVLQNTKNYLQLGKLSPSSLNYLLINYYDKVQEKGEDVIIHILENYFNRKNYSPADYLIDSSLAPLRRIWEKSHKRILSKSPLSKNRLTPMSEYYPPMSTSNLCTMPHITWGNDTRKSTCQSEVNQQKILDLRVQTLERELAQKNKRISQLRAQLKNLRPDDPRSSKDQSQNNTILQDLIGSQKQKQEQLLMSRNAGLASPNDAYVRKKGQGLR